MMEQWEPNGHCPWKLCRPWLSFCQLKLPRGSLPSGLYNAERIGMNAVMNSLHKIGATSLHLGRISLEAVDFLNWQPTSCAIRASVETIEGLEPMHNGYYAWQLRNCLLMRTGVRVLSFSGWTHQQFCANLLLASHHPALGTLQSEGSTGKFL